MYLYKLEVLLGKKIKTETKAIDFSNPDAESLYSIEIVDCLVLNVLTNYSMLIYVTKAIQFSIYILRYCCLQCIHQNWDDVVSPYPHQCCL